MFAILKLSKLEYKYELIDFNNDSNLLIDKLIEMSKISSLPIFLKESLKDSIQRNGYCMCNGSIDKTYMVLLLNISYLMTHETKGFKGFKTYDIDKYYMIEDLAKKIMPEIREILISKTFNDPFYIK